MSPDLSPTIKVTNSSKNSRTQERENRQMAGNNTLCYNRSSVIRKEKNERRRSKSQRFAYTCDSDVKRVLMLSNK